MIIPFADLDRSLLRSEARRYVGANCAAVKPWDSVSLRMVLLGCLRGGNVHLGLRILYGLVNQEAKFLMEGLCTWPDMESELEK